MVKEKERKGVVRQGRECGDREKEERKEGKD